MESIITRKDLVQLKNEMLSEIKQYLRTERKTPTEGWLRTRDVRQMLKISKGTLQNLRANGVLPFTKIGGTMYYNYSDIVKLMESNRIKRYQR